MHIHLGLKHKSIRKELAAQGLPSVPKDANPRYIHFLDRLTFFAGVVGPFTVLPQIYQIFSTQSAADVSLVSWSLIFIVTFPWIFYGVAHKDRSIIVSFILWEVANAAVVLGILIYR